MGTVPTVFLSGTYDDLIEERRAVMYALDRLQVKHNCMEFFGARPDNPLEVSLSEVYQSDIMVVLVGHQYGSLVPGMDISITEAEYNEGYRLKRPCLVYLKDENVPVLKKDIESDPKKTQALNSFKGCLKQRHHFCYFKDPLELAVNVAIDLNREVEKWNKERTLVPIPMPRPMPAPIQTMWNLKFAHQHSLTSYYQKLGHEPWAQSMEKVTNGKVKVAFYALQAFKTQDAWEGTKSGTIDIAWVFTGYFSSQFPLLDSITLPFVVPSAEVGSRAAWNVYQKYPEIQTQMADNKVLSICTSEPYGLLTTRKQVRTVADIKSMKVRATSSHSAQMISLLGGVPVMIPMPEIYLALQKGVIDGVLAPVMSILDWRLYEVAAYHTFVPTVCACFLLAMNRQVWNSMPPEIRQAIMDVSGEAAAIRYGSISDRVRKDMPNIVKAAGYRIDDYALPPDEVTKWIELAGVPVWNSWVNKMEASGNKSASKVLSDVLEMTKAR